MTKAGLVVAVARKAGLPAPHRRPCLDSLWHLHRVSDRHQARRTNSPIHLALGADVQLQAGMAYLVALMP
jgi:hypothetical protein